MDFTLTQEEKREFLEFARQAIERYLKDGTRIDLPVIKGVMAEKCGAFVTLHSKGQLRGCIGNMVGRGPLIETIREMAIAAATQDPRFHKVSSEEMKDIVIEISVLSPLEEIKDVSVIEVGKHGILMRQGLYQGVLLPQVATEYSWDRETFLTQTCFKAGLPPNAWQDPTTTIEIFSAVVFGEKEMA